VLHFLPTKKPYVFSRINGAAPAVQLIRRRSSKSLLCESNSRKSIANSLFGEASYDEAILNYDKALSFCPNYLEFEVAVLRSNIAACHIKLQDWKSAVESATKSLQCLERLDPPVKSPLKNEGGDGGGEITAQVVEEVDDSTAVIIEAFQKSGRSMTEVRKLRVKALMRRAKARTELEGWSDLQGANEGTLFGIPLRLVVPLT